MTDPLYLLSACEKACTLEGWAARFVGGERAGGGLKRAAPRAALHLVLQMGHSRPSAVGCSRRRLGRRVGAERGGAVPGPI